jgi:hypothetical protein
MGRGYSREAGDGDEPMVIGGGRCGEALRSSVGRGWREGGDMADGGGGR